MSIQFEKKSLETEITVSVNTESGEVEISSNKRKVEKKLQSIVDRLLQSEDCTAESIQQVVNTTLLNFASGHCLVDASETTSEVVNCEWVFNYKITSHNKVSMLCFLTEYDSHLKNLFED